nr:MAG TPA: YodL-like protein [Caudoviricetes sp.]
MQIIKPKMMVGDLVEMVDGKQRQYYLKDVKPA